MRFNTDRALFDAFPSARDHIATEPADLPPAAFLERLMSERKLSEAVSFCAYLLRRRDAVAWGCENLGSERRRDGTVVDRASVGSAEAWVREPSDDTRGAAFKRWQACDKSDPAAWLALGAAWSGGGFMPDLQVMAPPGPHLTAVMVRIAFLLKLAEIPEDKKAVVTQKWISAGLRHAEAGS